MHECQLILINDLSDSNTVENHTSESVVPNQYLSLTFSVIIYTANSLDFSCEMTRCSNEYVLLFLELWNVLFSHLKCHYDMYYSFLIFSCKTTYLNIDLWSLDNNSECILFLQALLKYKKASVEKPPFTYLFFILFFIPSYLSLFLMSLYPRMYALSQSTPFYFYFPFN